MRPAAPSRSLAAALALAVIGAGSLRAPAAAQEQESEQPLPTFGLATVITKVVDQNPLVRAYEMDVQRAQLDVDQLEGFWALPQVNFDSYSGVVPAARGNVVESPDTANDLDNLGPFYRFSVGVALPLYTFGRLEHGARAARNLVSVRDAEGDKARDDLTLEAIRAYWGVLAGAELLEVMTDMTDSYDDLIEQANEKEEDGTIDPNDAYEIKSSRFDIRQAFLASVETERLVKRSLAMFLELPPGQDYALDPSPTPAVAVSIDDLSALQVAAAEQHPQLRALRSAVGALEEVMEVERANRWPLILVGGGFSWAHSPNRDAQDNPFVFDEFNYTRVAAAFNVRWDLNFAKHDLNIMRRKLERDATDARRRALQMRVDIEVHEALERVLRQEQLLAAARESRRESRRWLRAAADDFDLGIGEAQPLIKAYRADYRLQAAVIQSEYDLNVAVAELALVIGGMNSYLEWVADGQIALD
jgi:outer membrane protein TolC